MSAPPLLLREPPQTLAARDDEVAVDDAAPRNPPLVLCRACSAHVTSTDAACERAGAHMHHLTNPAGISFDVGLYASAPGCVQTGTPTLEHSWFPPARWSLARCGVCGVQLGWFFTEGAGAFAGLILARIRIGAAPTRH